MADEKILKDEQLTEDQLEQIAGGTHEETERDMDYLERYCPSIRFHGSWDDKVGKLGELYRRAGMGLDSSERHANKYFDEYGDLERNYALRKLATKINRGEVDLRGL